MTIRRALMAAIVALLVLCFGVLLALFYRHAATAVETEARSAVTAAVADGQRRTEAFLAPAPAALGVIRALIEKRVVDPGNPAELQALFRAFLARDPQLAALYLAGTEGDFVFLARQVQGDGYVGKVIEGSGAARRVVVSRFDADFRPLAESIEPEDPFDPRERPWFRPRLERAATAWTAPYRFYTTGLDGVTASQVVAASGRWAGGVLGVDVNLQALGDFLARLPLGEGNRAALLDAGRVPIAQSGAGGIVAGTPPEPMIASLLAALPHGGAALAPGEVRLARFDHAGAPHLGAVAVLGGAGAPWTVAMAVPRASYFTWFDRFRTHVAVFAWIALLLGLLGAIAIADRLAHPFERLRANAARLAEGAYAELSPPSSRLIEARATEEAFAAMARGIRERDEDNRDMLYALRRFSEGVAQSPLAIFFTEPDGRVAYANEAFTRLTEYELIDVMNEPPVSFWRGRDPAAFYTDIIATVSQGEVWRGEIASRTKSGRPFDALLTVAPIRTASERVAGCVGILEDITERNRNEATLKAAVEEANRLARMRSMLLANMSHEIRTPLNAIIGFAETMEMRVFGPLGDPRYTDYVRGIRESGAHLLAILTDILDAATLEAGKLELHEETTALADLVRAALRMVENAAKARGLSVAATLDDRLLVRVDPVHLRQAILNILTNAVKYTPEGGRVDIAIGRDADGVLITIRDTGIGIAAENLDWVMKPFARVAGDAQVAAQPGVGLGLAIARSLMELHGGSLAIESLLRQGTNVTLRLPPERVVGGD